MKQLLACIVGGVRESRTCAPRAALDDQAFNAKSAAPRVKRDPAAILAVLERMSRLLASTSA